MPGVDWIPGVSHLKATIQAVTGDTEGAKKTLTNFHRECPGVSQVTSLVQLAAGDTEGALETQKICLGTVNNVANGIPVVGHAKGVVHHIVGDHKGGNQALNAATRSTVVFASGAAAAAATGGLAAIPAGITAGITYDAASSVITDEDQGYIAAIKNAADNPSAGSIFDAAAIPVGDGLAGYSGGQMAKSFQIKNLESARAAKLQQLESITDGGSGNSGAVVKLGREINSLTSEINTIKHGTPKNWIDVKSGETGVASSSSNAAGSVPITGYADQDKNQKDKVPDTNSVPRDVEDISVKQEDLCLEQEDALYYDSYVETNTTENNKGEKQRRLQQLEEQALQGHVHQAYKNVIFTTLKILSDLLERLNKDRNREPDRNPQNIKEDIYQLTRWTWLLLNMPEEFSHSVIVQLNSPIQGLYHSFIRHIDEWREVIPINVTLIQRLSPIMAEIQRLASAQNQNEAQEARAQFKEARRQLSREIRDDLQIAMAEIQMSMYRFIQENITIGNFLGRDVNVNGSEQLLFKVKTKNGKTVVMVICVSNQRYESETRDKRPTRIAITVFFKSWAQFKLRPLTETKEEMLKKRKNC